MDFTSVTVAGPGLLGGSLLLALRERFPAVRLRAWCRRPEAVSELERRLPGVSATHDPVLAVSGTDLLVLGMPIGGMVPFVNSLLGRLPQNSGLLVTDVGSVKGPVVASLTPLVESLGAVFVGSHPMAGSEKTGLEHAVAGLFEGCVTFVTPSERTGERDLARIEAFWECLGATPCRTNPAVHDAAVARVSHLPHAVAALLARTVLFGLAPDSLEIKGSGKGLRDTTRIAGSAPEMWAEILLENQAALLPLLREFHNATGDLLSRLETGDQKGVLALLEEARAGRALLVS